MRVPSATAASTRGVGCPAILGLPQHRCVTGCPRVTRTSSSPVWHQHKHASLTNSYELVCLCQGSAGCMAHGKGRYLLQWSTPPEVCKNIMEDITCCYKTYHTCMQRAMDLLLGLHWGCVLAVCCQHFRWSPGDLTPETSSTNRWTTYVIQLFQPS